MPRRERGGSRDRGGEEGKDKTRERTEEDLKMCPQRGPLLPIRPHPLKVPQPLQQQLEQMFTQRYEPVGGKGAYYIYTMIERVLMENDSPKKIFTKGKALFKMCN